MCFGNKWLIHDTHTTQKVDTKKCTGLWSTMDTDKDGMAPSSRDCLTKTLGRKGRSSPTSPQPQKSHSSLQKSTIYRAPKFQGHWGKCSEIEKGLISNFHLETHTVYSFPAAGSAGFQSGSISLGSTDYSDGFMANAPEICLFS